MVAWLSLLIGAATVFWLGYSVGRVQNIGDVALRAREADTDRFSLSRGGVMVHFERLGGDGKPFVRSSAGPELLDLSDWDTDSHVVVDGTLFELVRLYPQSAVDYARNRIAETLNGDGWLLEREMTLAEDGGVRVDYSFVARRPIRRVDLALAHTHQFFADLQVREASVTAALNALRPDQIAGGVTAAPAYRLSVRGDGIRFRTSRATAYGPSAFIADMSADNPPVDQRSVLGTETVSVEPI